MRKKLLGVAVAALAMTLVAPFATAEEINPTPPGELPPLAASPTPTPTPTPAVQPKLTPEQAVYVTPGYHLVAGRYWYTSCEMYSSTTVRCRTSIYASTVFQKDGQWFTQNAWVFNNLTYLPSPRSVWANNPLGSTGEWTATDGRKWRSECDTAATGRGACRSYAVATTASVATGQVTQKTDWVFNGIVKFDSQYSPWVKSIPATNPRPAGVPYPTAPVPVVTHPLVQSGFRLDQRCMTGRAFCVSKGQDKMAWVINGKVQTIVDVRFGRTATPTRNGAFKIGWKSRDHFSSIYKVDMPFALFFDGGIAIHYSANFARVGYSGGSGGCVNVRDYAQMERFFDIARVGDKVIVYN
ncbi:L,D-transpeptidase [Tessaracoccus sp. MC1865]|uniref:L,D-transpeptidase n=1 Tax=unclassified Tessaracoccus TaxID=2635419 RepID=UPI001AE7C3E8|nr:MULTISPECIES: L,D-transpeptidase [unclassified Tessaracoccus]QTO37122.1 L,D-transpeptidase [Tessaracoccus sp. MC1865]